MSAYTWLQRDEDAWMLDGACRGYPADVFFPSRGEDQRRALNICAGCTVQTECLTYAMTNRIYHGVWGGVSEKGRRRIARARNAASATPLCDNGTALAPGVVSTQGELTNTEARLRGLDASAEPDATSPHTRARKPRTAA